jgi:ABC-2 type transport system permease protein
VFGSLASSAGQVFANSEQARRFIERGGHNPNLSAAFLAAVVSEIGMLGAVYGVHAMVRARMEETEVRVEPLLATPVSRTEWLGSHLVFALVGSGLLVALGGVFIGLTGGNAEGVGGFGAVVSAALAQVLPVWVLVGIAAALIGLSPRNSNLAWAALVAAILVTLFGPLLRLNHMVMDLSPFSHLPQLPGGTLTAPPVLGLGLTALALVLAGVAGIRQRDIG